MPGANVLMCNSDSVTYKPAGVAEIMPPIALPYYCGNQPFLQLRWVYYQSKIGGGQRVELGVDEINVTSDIFTASKNVEATYVLKAFPNPTTQRIVNINKTITGQVFSAIGAPVATVSNTNKIDLSIVPNGVYFLKTTKGEIVKLILQ